MKRVFYYLSIFLLIGCSQDALEFHEGLAIFDKNGKMGFINKSKKFIVEPKFFKVFNFSEGVAGACIKRGVCGYIDKSGKYIIEPKFHDTWKFQNGIALVEYQGKYGFINISGEFITPLFDTLDKAYNFKPNYSDHS